MSRDMKALAQPYVGSVAEYQDILFPARATADLADATDSVNTANKFLGNGVTNRHCSSTTSQTARQLQIPGR